MNEMPMFNSKHTWKMNKANWAFHRTGEPVTAQKQNLYT